MELRQLVDQHRSEVLKIQNSLQSLKKEHAACYDLLMAKLRESANSSAALEGSSPDGKSVAENYRGGLVELLQAFVERSSANLVRYQTALDHYEKELGRLQGVKQEQQSCLQLLQQSHVLDSVTPPPSVVARAGGLPSGYLLAQLSELLQNLSKGELRLNGNSDSPGSKNTTHQVNWIVEKYDRIISSKDEQEHQISMQLRMFQRDYEKCIDLLNAYLVEPFKSPFPAASSGSVYFSPNDLYAKLSAFIAQYKTERGGGLPAVEEGETLAVASLKDELVRVRRDVDTCFELLNANSPNSLTPHPRMRTLREEVQKYIDRVVEESKQWQLIIEDYGVVLEGKERSEANLARILKQTLSQQEECLRTLHQAGFITDGELEVATNPPLLLEGSNDSAGNPGNNNNNSNNEFSTPGARVSNKAGTDLDNNKNNNGLDTPASDTSLALQTPSGHGDGSPTLAAGRAILSGVRNLLDHYEHLKRSSPGSAGTGGPMTRSRSKLALEMELVQDEYIALRDLVATALDRELQRVNSLTASSAAASGSDADSLALKPPTRPTASSPGKSRPLYYDVQYLNQLIAYNETAQVVQEYSRALEIISEHVPDMQPWQHLGDRVHVYQYLLQGITQMANMLAGYGPPATRRSSRGSDSGSNDLKRRMRHAEAEVARLRPYYDQFKECVHFLSANFRSPIGTDGKEVNERSLLKQLQHLTVEYSNNIDTYHAMVLEFQHTAQELEKSSSRAKDLRQRLKDREASVHKRTSENDDLRREISDLEAKQRAVEPQMKEYEQQIEALQKEVAALREHGGDVSSLQRRLEDSEKKAKEATLTASEREEELSLAHSKALDEIASLQEQLYARDNQATELELLKDERANCMALLRAHEQGDAGEQSAAATSEDYPAGALSDTLATFIQSVRDESSTHNEARNDEAERIARLEAALAEAEARNQALEAELAEQAQEIVHLHAQTPEAKAKRRSLHTDHDPRGGRDWTPSRADDEDNISTQVVDEPDDVTVSPTVQAEASEQVTVSPSSQQQGAGNAGGTDTTSHGQGQQSPSGATTTGPGSRGNARSGPGRSKRGGKRGPGSGGRVQQPKPSSAPSSPEQQLTDANTPGAAADNNNDDAVVPEVRTEDEEAEMAAQEDGAAAKAATSAPMPAGQISPPTGGLRPPRHTLHDVERKYQFGQLLGTGSFAEVKYATSRENGNQFAAKIVDKTRWMKYLDCIQREVDILKELDHENIIHLYDVFDTQTTLFMMTELAPGGDLLEHIEQRGPLRENEAKNVMRKMGEALKYLHTRGVVHRDLKPENILLGTGGVNDPNVKLCDFGHSAYLSDRDSGPNTAFGTFIYLAPEVILTKKYDCPMDLWSLGVILYICFSGQFPFDGQSDAELFEQIVHGQYDFRDPCWRVVSPEAREVVRSLLSVDVNQRLTAETLLSHPWLTGERPASQSNSRIMSSSSSRQHGNHPPIQATTRSHSRGAQPPGAQPRPGQYNSPHMQGHRPPGAPPQREQFGQAPWRGTHPVGASPMHASPRAPMGYAGPRW